MCKKTPLFLQFSNKPVGHEGCVIPTICCVLVMCVCMITAQGAKAAGGCGSVCLPLDALNPDKTQLLKGQYRVGITSKYGEFDNYREGSDDLPNPGGNEATISQTTVFTDIGITKKLTASLLIPYINKKQKTNRFGTRVANGVGDISVFGRYEIVSPKPTQRSAVAMGLGLKFPTGSIDQPNDSQRLPPAFQVGSGAYDIVPTFSYIQNFNFYLVYAEFFARIPLEENELGYKFGNEYELNTAVDFSLDRVLKGLSTSVGISYLNAGYDNDSAAILPARVREGTKVLNTGGQFVDLVPGITYGFGKTYHLQAKFSIPIYENWHGERSRNVGQVAPDLTAQITFVYNGIM